MSVKEWKLYVELEYFEWTKENLRYEIDSSFVALDVCTLPILLCDIR
jgi:hypothetical protein